MKFHNNRPLRVVVAALAVSLTVTACGGRQDSQDATKGEGGRLTIGTGNTTGVYYPLGGGIAKLVTDNLEGYRATASETGASGQNVKGVVTGDFAMGFSVLDTAADARNGEGAFAEPQPVEALTRLYPSPTQVVVRSDSGIDSIEDMRGKRVSIGPIESATDLMARRMLKVAGLDPKKDLAAQNHDLPQAVDGMKDGTLDALFLVAGLPSGGITDLTTSQRGKVKVLDVGSLLPKLRQQYGPVYEEGVIPADAYGMSQDVNTIYAPNVLFVKEGFDDELAEKIVRLIYENKAYLKDVHPAAAQIALDKGTRTEPLPLNPGAKRALADLAAKG